jgi:hypothetical protein
MASSPVRPIAVMVAALLPTGLLAWYQSGPARDQPIDVRLEHSSSRRTVFVVAA